MWQEVSEALIIYQLQQKKKNPSLLKSSFKVKSKSFSGFQK